MSNDVETVAILTLDGEQGWCAFNLDDEVHVRSLIDEMRNHIDGSYLPGQVDEDDDRAYVTVEVRRKPAGYVAALPEFDGW